MFIGDNIDAAEWIEGNYEEILEDLDNRAAESFTHDSLFAGTHGEVGFNDEGEYEKLNYGLFSICNDSSLMEEQVCSFSEPNIALIHLDNLIRRDSRDRISHNEQRQVRTQGSYSARINPR